MPGDNNSTLHGSMTAMVTPFSGGEPDWARVAILVETQIAAGTDWLVPCGTTGESPTLSDAEKLRLIETVLAAAKGRVPVMAGTGTNDTASTIRQTVSAARAGTDAALVVTPYYNRPTQEGLFRHFAAVAEAVDLPIVLYNVPARTGVSLSNDTIVRLRATASNVVAVKDATGNVEGVTDLLSRCDIAVLCGDDALTWPMMAVGAVGVISVISNLVPEWMKALVSAALRGDAASALPYHRRVHDLASSLSRFGPNPIPIKTALAVAGVIEEEFRLPLCPVDGEARAAMERILRRHELLRVPTGE